MNAQSPVAVSAMGNALWKAGKAAIILAAMTGASNAAGAGAVTNGDLPERRFAGAAGPTCLEGEDRDGWMERFRQMRPQWPAISDEEFAAFESHQRASDYAETAATWKGMAREAGFEQADELFIGDQQLARVCLFRH